MTQLTSAPQGGLAEFNPFSEVGAHALLPVVLQAVLGISGCRVQQRPLHLPAATVHKGWSLCTLRVGGGQGGHYRFPLEPVTRGPF